MKSLPGVKIQEEVQDVPRKVTDFHFCRSQPKPRNHPQLFGLSKAAVDMIGVDYDEARKDPDTALFLSGSKLMLGSEVLLNLCSLLPITTVATNLVLGRGSWEMEGRICSGLLSMGGRSTSCNSREVDSLPSQELVMAIV